MTISHLLFTIYHFISTINDLRFTFQPVHSFYDALYLREISCEKVIRFVVRQIG